jgi:LysR family cys regulon transcriptional activator
MKIEQLRILCEVVDQGFSMSRAADALDTSQPNISKQMRLLEEYLAVELLLRRGGRIIGAATVGA